MAVWLLWLFLLFTSACLLDDGLMFNLTALWLVGGLLFFWCAQ